LLFAFGPRNQILERRHRDTQAASKPHRWYLPALDHLVDFRFRHVQELRRTNRFNEHELFFELVHHSSTPILLVRG
jgi:hypothetical protein